VPIAGEHTDPATVAIVGGTAVFAASACEPRRDSATAAAAAMAANTAAMRHVRRDS
jgi:hypothetical protein